LQHRGVRSKTIKGFRRLTARWSAASEMDAVVADHRGRLLNKWKHYFEIYDRHFAHLRDADVSILEIGVESGGSLDLWRSYFGPQARIVGLDINPKCKAFEGPNTTVRIGDQGDPAFLDGIAAEFGPFDIVIEDGSHAFDHQILAFKTLFPHIRTPGFYCCEDLCTSYWEEEYGGGVRKPGTGIEFFKHLIDEQNAWFSRDDAARDPDALAHVLSGLHFYPALMVIEKREVSPLIMTPVGRRERAS
jgi:cephalosporin hydroxylase